MFNTRQTILASRPAATVLALVLVAGLTTPFLMLPRAHADDPPLPCTVVNNNGCTELSATPPEDVPAVPPNIVLMLDDSGSMDYDYMPDWDYLAVRNEWGQRNPNVNGVYYNPTQPYTPPPKADGTSYPDSSFPKAFRDGFTNTSTVDVRSYIASSDADLNHQFRYGQNLPTTLFNPGNDYGPAVWGGGSPGSCPSGYYPDPNDSSQCIRDPVSPTEKWTCNPGDSGPSWRGGRYQCRHREFTEHGHVDTWYDATDAGPQCPSGTTYDSSDSMCHYSPRQPSSPTPDHWTCPNGGSPDDASLPEDADPPPECKSNGSRIYVYAFMYVLAPSDDPTLSDKAHAYFVVPTPDPDTDPAEVVSNGWCAYLYPGKSPYTWNGFHTDAAHCEAADDIAKYTDKDGNIHTLLASDGTPLTVGQNIANWFSYYRTRMLMAKSSLMTAFTGLDPKYRFGFASINGNGKAQILGPEYPAATTSTSVPYVTFDDSGNGGGDSTNRLAVVQPFGDGTDSSDQKTKFWNWIAKESPDRNTPLRKALQAVGEYYKTDQPWTAMKGDPGYTDSSTQFSCRASFTILTTDGFWNGGNPSGIGYAANSNGPVQPVPAGNPVNQYQAVPPFSGGGADSGASLADVATYYWENDLSDMPNEVTTTKGDPATWQHMTTFTIGLGFDPKGIQPFGDVATKADIDEIFAWAQGTGPEISDFGWPTPDTGSVFNIADLAHAAVNGHGDFFNAKSPQELADAFSEIAHQIGERTVAPTPSAVNASVVSLGALSFSTGYTTGDWSGNFWGVTLNPDGSVNPTALWKAESNLAPYHSSSGYSDRKVYSDSYKMVDGNGTFAAFQFNVANEASLDTVETAGLEAPALSGPDDTLDHRIQYLLGDNTYETSLYRSRTTLLGAILRSAPVYVSGATGNYYSSWPKLPNGNTAPENDSGAQTYDEFVTQQSTHTGTVYVGANDGMLHAFNAPVPTCSTYDESTGVCSLYTAGTDAGKELWAFIPRAVYANLGNLTTRNDFQFRPTVDATPVRRDVFFSGDKNWHTILAGGVGIGGRGVYALDITDPSSFQAPINSYPSAGVLWEFDADMTDKTADCVSIVGTSESGTCNANDLGYTVSEPNIGRLANGQWVVLVANGYFPDCTTPDIPTADGASCEAIAAQVPRDSSGKPFSSLFVIDAETGDVIAELKTPTDISGVTSFGLASPVLGDYDNDQVDDVAFAGDAQGNLWRFDMTDGDASNWKVTLVYQGISDENDHQGVQPITTMPRLFPDPLTNRFMVVFGTGRLLGVGDNSNGTTQSIIAVRDDGTTYDQADLVQQYMHEYVEPEFLPDGVTANPLAGTSVRCVTGGADDTCDTADSAHPATAVNDVPASKGGWFINLYTTTSEGVHNDSGERVVVNPGAIFASNTVVFETLITGALNTDACNPSTEGAIIALNATSGGPSGVSALGGWPVAGGRIKNARTSGSLPIMSALGGGQAYLPGAALAPSGNPMSIDAPIWRRRSWQEIKQNP